MKKPDNFFIILFQGTPNESNGWRFQKIQGECPLQKTRRHSWRIVSLENNCFWNTYCNLQNKIKLKWLLCSKKFCRLFHRNVSNENVFELDMAIFAILLYWCLAINTSATEGNAKKATEKKILRLATFILSPLLKYLIYPT